MNISCIVVLYNKAIDESSTLKFFSNHTIPNTTVYVYDNSTKNYGNKIECQKKGWIYLSEKKNVGLAAAYNKTIEYVLKSNRLNIDYFMILDDDSKLSKEYFDFLNSILNKENIQIGVPIIKINDRILSPCLVEKCGRIKSVKSIKSLNNKNITAINNGMIIKSTVFKKIKYNSDLFVDYVDHDFIRQAKKNNIKITVFNYCLEHNMSIVDNSINEKGRLIRFKIYSKDLKKYYTENLTEKIFVRIHLLNMGIKYFNKYHNIKFIKLAM